MSRFFIHLLQLEINYRYHKCFSTNNHNPFKYPLIGRALARLLNNIKI